MDQNYQTVELDLHSGITTNAPLHVIGPHLWKAQNAVWEYRYPRSEGPGPWFLRQPINFAYKTTTAYTNATSFRDIGYTKNTTTGLKILVLGADNGSPYPTYKCWPSGGGSALAFDAGISPSPFTVDSTRKTPGCSVYWSTPGNYPNSNATTGVIALVYATGASNTITRASGSFVTDGFVTGRQLTVSKSNKNNGTYTITNVTATVITVSETLTAESTGTSKLDSNSTLPDGVGAFIFSHPEGNHIYYLMDDSTTIYSLTQKVPNCPEGALAMALHLDRVWFATEAPNTSGSASLVYTTDPFDISTVRPESVIKIPGRVRCMIPGQFGAIDVSGVPHLIIGTSSGVWCLDGDPLYGGAAQSSLRQLTPGVGIGSQYAAAVTPYGVFFLGTDGDLWLIPPGCQTVVSVGQPIRNVLGVNNVTGAVTSLGNYNNTDSLLWFDPYLYIYPGGETAHYYIAEPAKNSITFWGPGTIDPAFGSSREAIVRSPETAELYVGYGSNKEGVHIVNSIDVTPTAGAARFVTFDEYVQPTGSYPNGTRTGHASYIQSGLITVPAHLVQIERVILETLKIPSVSGTTVVWTVQVYDEKGNGPSTGKLYPEEAITTGTYLQNVIATQHFIFPNPLPASRGLTIKISATSGASLALQRVLVKFRTTPAEF